MALTFEQAYSRLTQSQKDELNKLQAQKTALERQIATIDNKKIPLTPIETRQRRSLFDQTTAIQNQQDTILSSPGTVPSTTGKSAPYDTAGSQVKNKDPVASQNTSTLSDTEKNKIKQADRNKAGTNENEVPLENRATKGNGDDFNIGPDFSGRGGGGGVLSGSNLVKTDKTKQDQPEEPKSVLVNPLHRYPGYTYNLSLHLLTKDEYNEIMKKQNFVANRVLIASAGRYNNNVSNDGKANQSSFNRNQNFKEDFYFENLNINTIIGLNEHSRSSNAIKIDFNIIEPYGITLMNRIIRVAEEVGSPNYVDQPYLLQIDFFAINDAGEIEGQLHEHTKRIPIRLIKLDVKASNRGSEYAFECVPYNHSAFDLSTVRTPVHFEIVAQTVESFFQSTEAETAFTDFENQREEFRSQYGVNSSGTRVGPSGQTEVIPLAAIPDKFKNVASQDPVYRVKSYGSAINAYYAEQKRKSKIKVSDTYFFKFHPDIGKAKFPTLSKLPHKNTAMTGIESAPVARKGNIPGAQGTSALDYTLTNFSINYGTSLDQVLNYVIRNSSFIQDQLEIPEDYENNLKAWSDAVKKGPLTWYKIVPTVQLGDYDKVRQRYSRIITYYVIPYTVKNVKLGFAPQGQAKEAVKRYDYIYTGKNTDIIDFDINFNFLYYSSVTAYRNYFQKTFGLNQPGEETNKSDNVQGYEGAKYQSEEEEAANKIQPHRELPSALDARSRATGSVITTKGAAAVELEQTLYTKKGADMLQIDLKIIGDPQWIKQDDVFFPPSIESTSKDVDGTTIDSRLIANGSLHMDKEEVNVQLTFRSPVDIDESTSLYDFEQQYVTSLFTGMYKVISVDSSFAGGEFIQTLHCVRLFRQLKQDYTAGTTTKSAQRNTDSNSPQAPLPSDYKVAENTVKTSVVEDSGRSVSAPATAADPATDPSTQRLKQVGANSPTANIDEQNQPAAAALPPKTVADPNAVFGGISAEDLSYIRSQTEALGLNPSALNGYLTNRIEDYEPNLRAKVLADVAKLKEILRKRNRS